jgi:cell division protein FtsI/penicillin-binding protein 2
MNQGATVELTIDATLQSVAEAELLRQVEEMDADGGSVVILDPRTGEVLAMANAPAFDPNRYSSYPPAARRNRAVTDTFEPGSTMKPFVVAAAIDAGVVRPTDRFDCENGKMKIGGWTIHDHHPHKVLSVPEIIEVSSNFCSAKIGAVLGADRLYDYLKSFGFARPTDVDCPARWRPTLGAFAVEGDQPRQHQLRPRRDRDHHADGLRVRDVGERRHADASVCRGKITDLDGDVLLSSSRGRGQGAEARDRARMAACSSS